MRRPYQGSVLTVVCLLPLQLSAGPSRAPTSAAAEINEAQWPAIGRSVLFRERPREVTVENFTYYAVEFGPEAQWIIDHQEDEYLKRLLTRLAITDGTQTVRLEHGWLPLRSCDYALLIAERLAGGCRGDKLDHSFGPGTSYELRDQSRQAMAKALFHLDIVVPADGYTYVDESGNDVTTTYRNSPGFP